MCFYIKEEEVCTFWGSWSGASDDQQLWRKHPTRCAGFQLLSREFDRTPAKRRCATTRPPIPVNAKGKSVHHLQEGIAWRRPVVFYIVSSSHIAVGCDRLHTGDGLYPLATQRYWEDCLSAVLQMEGGRRWTLQACSGQNLPPHQISQAAISITRYMHMNADIVWSSDSSRSVPELLRL